MTIYDISEKAGVSIATVSRVLNGGSNVSPKTKEKVMEVIRKYEYTPNAFARGLGLNSMQTIGILCADSSDIYLAKAVYYIEQLLRTNGYNSILCCTGYDLDNIRDSLALLSTKKVDSVILIGSHFVSDIAEENTYIAEFASQIPVMILNAILDAPGVYCTLTDDYGAMEKATLEMIQSGVKDILYLYNSKSYSGKHKLAGYIDTMKKHGLYREELVRYYDNVHSDIHAIADYLTEIADSGVSFNGLVAADDVLAVGALRYAKNKNLALPDDLSVIGYNNSLLTECCDPELTSVDNNLETLCNYLIDSLMRVLDHQDEPREKVFDCTLVKRGTTLN